MKYEEQIANSESTKAFPFYYFPLFFFSALRCAT
jgi:hypothetical protein